MARRVFVNGVTSDSPRDAFSMIFSTANNSWTESEPGSARDVFDTKSGTYNVVASVTHLVNGRNRVGHLNPLNPSTATEGMTGEGKSEEKGRLFKWTVEIVQSELKLRP